MRNFFYILSVCSRNTVVVFLTGRPSDPVEEELSRHCDLKKTSISYYIYICYPQKYFKIVIHSLLNSRSFTRPQQYESYVENLFHTE